MQRANSEFAPHAAQTRSHGPQFLESPEYEKNFHDGHVAGWADGRLGTFSQFAAADNPNLPGRGEGYRAGQRAAIQLRGRW